MTAYPANPASRRRPALLLVPLALLTVAACGGDDSGGDETADATDETEPVREGSDDSASGTVSREEAEQAALDHVGEGRVTWSGPEDDRGAAWEVEITRPDGSEVDVLVAADGSIIKQVDKFGSDPRSQARVRSPPKG